VTVIHSIASTQPRVAILHLIVHEVASIFGGPVAVEVSALRGGGARATKINGFWFDCRISRPQRHIAMAVIKDSGTEYLCNS
jgi:hypothetical protein